jgi:hypothetical protein
VRRSSATLQGLLHIDIDLVTRHLTRDQIGAEVMKLRPEGEVHAMLVLDGRDRVE